MHAAKKHVEKGNIVGSEELENDIAAG